MSTNMKGPFVRPGIAGVRAFGCQVDFRWDGWLPLSVRTGRNKNFGTVIPVGRVGYLVIGRLR